MSRRGKWRNRTTFAKNGWKFACDKESFQITEKRFPRGYKCTGESVGRQIWYKDESEEPEEEIDLFDFNPSDNPNAGDKVLRHQQVKSWCSNTFNDYPDVNEKPSTAKEGSLKAMEFYQMLQCTDGHWAGDYGGPMFLMPGLVVALYITQAPLEQYKKDAMIQYLVNHQQEDGMSYVFFHIDLI